jgi:signal transduction histidine kinase
MSLAVFRKFWLPWTFVGLLTAVCATLAIVQYGWINQLSNPERTRLRAEFQMRLTGMGQEFDQRVTSSYEGLKPTFAEITEWGTRAACVRQYRRWSASSEPLFRRIAIVTLDDGAPSLQTLDPQSGDFIPAAWPPAWKGMRKRFEARAEHSSEPALPQQESALIDSQLPDSTWLVAELSLDYIRATLLPDLVTRHLAGPRMFAYDVDLAAAAEPGYKVLETSPHPHRKQPDGTVDVLRIDHAARWTLSVFHSGNALEDQVTIARGRNVALSLALLLLILAMIVVLLHSARRSQQLAELQMNFVAGVSHELRTPLTVIRTAAYNLRGRLAAQPEQVEKYACLIQKESETLSVVVEQILRYGAAARGRVIGERHKVNADTLIRDCIASSAAVKDSNLTVECHIDNDLPTVFADQVALKHALQNLLDNALKYGTEASGWVGIYARSLEESGKRYVEIRVADRGPGIPSDEQPHVFDAFFRGRRAIQDQMHGTGLGLNLVKKIIDAHEGTIEVKSEPGHGAEFVVRLPAGEEEIEDVFSHSPD